ncbi:hypothetical protein ACJRO7_011804 [Eucalyptus globulus]|uniref:Uncharacterized protein n=1 Tax=Eucalyptus globulus TaxID=34317 RepID=A0ABD3LM18_EUCGL
MGDFEWGLLDNFVDRFTAEKTKDCGRAASVTTWGNLANVLATWRSLGGLWLRNGAALVFVTTGGSRWHCWSTKGLHSMGCGLCGRVA